MLVILRFGTPAVINRRDLSKYEPIDSMNVKVRAWVVKPYATHVVNLLQHTSTTPAEVVVVEGPRGVIQVRRGVVEGPRRSSKGLLQ